MYCTRDRDRDRERIIQRCYHVPLLDRHWLCPSHIGSMPGDTMFCIPGSLSADDVCRGNINVDTFFQHANSWWAERVYSLYTPDEYLVLLFIKIILSMETHVQFLTDEKYFNCIFKSSPTKLMGKTFIGMIIVILTLLYSIKPKKKACTYQ